MTSNPANTAAEPRTAARRRVLSLMRVNPEWVGLGDRTPEQYAEEVLDAYLAEAAQDRPAEPGLREALHSITTAEAALSMAHDAIAALAASPPPAPEATASGTLADVRIVESPNVPPDFVGVAPAPEAGLLDEHRLGLAITAADERIQEGAGAGLWLHYIAAEYARLTPAPADPTDE